MTTTTATYMYAIFENKDAWGDLSSAIEEEATVYPNDGTNKEAWAASQVTVTTLRHEEWVTMPNTLLTPVGHQGNREWKQTVRRVMITGHAHTIMHIIGRMASRGCPELISAGRV